jgi:hypothetical protein
MDPRQILEQLAQLAESPELELPPAMSLADTVRRAV